MGVIKSGINGPFSGKTGSVIGKNWRKVHYMTGLYEASKTKPTPGQQKQRNKFRLMKSFLAPISKVLQIGFSSEDTSSKTAYNLAFSYNIRWAITGENEDLKIDYSHVVLSRGNLPKIFNMTMEPVPGKGFRISWPTIITNAMLSPEDKLTVIAFAEKPVFHSIDRNALRSDGEIVIEIQDDFLSHAFHVLIFFTSPKGNNSATQYLGEITCGEEPGKESTDLTMLENERG